MKNPSEALRRLAGSRFARALPPVAALALIALTALPRPTRFSIVCDAEALEVTTSAQHAVTWYADDVELVAEPPAAPARITGILSIEPGTRIIVERIGMGPFKAALIAATKDGYAATFAADDAPPRRIRSGAVIRIGGLADRAVAGHSIVFPLSGALSVGNPTEAATQPLVPIVRQGQVVAYGQNLFSTELYKISTQSLDPGDVVFTAQDDRPVIGFISLDERPAIHATFHANASELRILRPPSSGYTIGSTLFDRVKNDATLQGFWATFAFLLAIRKLAKEVNE